MHKLNFITVDFMALMKYLIVLESRFLPFFSSLQFLICFFKRERKCESEMTRSWDFDDPKSDDSIARRALRTTTTMMMMMVMMACSLSLF